MKKKILFITTALSVFLMFSFSCVFANTSEAMNGIRNIVGGAENVVENTASGIANGVRNGTNTLTKDMNNTMNMDGNNNTNMDNSNKYMNNNMMGTISSDMNNGGYTATRTSADITDTTFFGISANTWTWIILIAAAVGIITLIWSYVTQNTNNYDSYDE